MDDGKINGFGTHEELLANPMRSTVRSMNPRPSGGGDFDEKGGDCIMAGPGPRRTERSEIPGENPGKIYWTSYEICAEKITELHLSSWQWCLFLSVSLANVQGTMFMKTLIDQLYHATDAGSSRSGFRSAACMRSCGLLYFI